MKEQLSILIPAIFVDIEWGAISEVHVLCAWTAGTQVFVPSVMLAGRRATEKRSVAKGTHSTRYLDLADINSKTGSSWRMDQRCLRFLLFYRRGLLRSWQVQEAKQRCKLSFMTTG